MCFVKHSPNVVNVEKEEVVRHEADASLTKNSDREKNNVQGFKQNIKTSAFGLEDNAKTDKKTLLGE